MKKMVYVICVIAVIAGLSGCPVIGGSISAGKLAGTWQWVEAARLVDPTTVNNFDSQIVAQNFADNGRVRKTLIFDEEKNFTYTEETFLPDRPLVIFANVAWSWKTTYQARGTFTTAGYTSSNSLLAIPGLNTELHVDITEYTDTYRSDVLRDGQWYYEYLTSTSTAGAENPLVLRGLLGMNPFDELMVSWAQFSVGKDLSYNYSFSSNVETYIRLAEGE